MKRPCPAPHSAPLPAWPRANALFLQSTGAPGLHQTSRAGRPGSAVLGSSGSVNLLSHDLLTREKI